MARCESCRGLIAARTLVVVVAAAGGCGKPSSAAQGLRALGQPPRVSALPSRQDQRCYPTHLGSS